MITSGIRSRQPRSRVAWTRERLVHERALALGQAIDTSTWTNYSSALNSYLNFIRLHDFPVEPTPDTLSFFAVYMSFHIKPDSVDTYLSGICQQLEPFFPDVRKHRKSPLVHRTLDGCKRSRNTPTRRKHALTTNNLITVTQQYNASLTHDDMLFLTQLFSGFFALMRLGELTYPDDIKLRNPRKISTRLSVEIFHESLQFQLPAHKADKFYEGNLIVLQKINSAIDPYRHFLSYLQSRDRLFPYSSPLWLRESGTVPTRSFFITRFKKFFGSDFGGQSMRAGGATRLAENGASPAIIQATGRWSSEAFKVYIRKHPTLIQAIIYARETLPTSTS